MEPEDSSQVTILKAQLKDAKSRLALREKELSHFRKQIETVQEDHENLCKLVSTLKSSSVSQENALLRQQNEQLVHDFDLLERRVNEVANAHLLDSQEKEMMALELERLYEENERKTADRLRTIGIYEERLEKLRTQLKCEEHESQQLRAENDLLRREAEEHFSCSELRQQLQSELADLREAYDELRKQQESLETDEEERSERMEQEDGNASDEELDAREESDYEQVRTEVAELREKLMDSDVEKHLWKKALQHSLLVCVPTGRKTEAQKLVEEIDEKCDDTDFIAKLPQLISLLAREQSKSPLSTARYSSPRTTPQKRDGALSLRVVAKLQATPEGRELFQAVGDDQVRFIGGSKEVERLTKVDSVCGDSDRSVSAEIQRLLGKGEMSPVLVLVQGAHESEASRLFSLCVTSVLSMLLSVSSDVSFSFSAVSESEVTPLYPDIAVSFTEDKGDLPMAKLNSLEEVEKVMRELPATESNMHRVLGAAAGGIGAFVVEMSLEEPSGADVLCKVLSALYAQRHHVPFRNSTLTTLLRPCLHFDLRLFALLSVHQTAIEESLKVLHFGSELLAQRDFSISRQRALALKLPNQTIRPQTACNERSVFANSD